MKPFIQNKPLRVLLYSLLYYLVFYTASLVSFDKGADLLNMSVIILPVFLIHNFIPQRFRSFVFPALSLLIGFYVFDVVNALLFFSLLLIFALCMISKLKWSMKLSVALLYGIALLILLRFGLRFGAFAYLAPFLAAILMFRTIIVLYDLLHNHNTIPDKASAFSYFFGFPQLFFPVMPIVDYKLYLNGSRSDENDANHQKALTQFATGLFLFVCYKVINLHLDASVYGIGNLTQLGLYIISKNIVLFKVCGIFIFALGFFSMFGIALPSSFGVFPLAASFRDYWKDVNRFWRDFILRIIYYPLYFRLRKTKIAAKEILLIALTFSSSCFFHFYQLYWTTGYFRFKMTDVIYWLSLGFLVFYSNRRYQENMKTPPPETNGVLSFLRLSLSVLFVQLVMSFLFFIWTSESLAEAVFLLRMGSFFSGSFILLLLFYWLLILLGLLVMDFITGKSKRYEVIRDVFSFVVPVAILVLFQLYRSGKADWSEAVYTEDYLTVAQRESNEESYYSKLMSASANSRMGKEGSNRMSPLAQIGVASPTVLRQELKPLVTIEFNQTTISTNSFGLRDKEYSLARPAGVTRVVVLGGSYEMGTGVNGNEVFEAVAEDWLNKYSGHRYELMNFGAPMYTCLQDEYIFQNKAMRFNPNVVLLFSHTGEEQRLLNSVTRLIREGFVFNDAFLNFIIEKARVKASMPAIKIKYRLRPYMNVLFFELYKRIATTCQRNNIRPVWIFLPTINERIESGEKISNLRDLAARVGFETHSLQHVYQGYGRRSLMVSGIDPHPNHLGHTLIAGAVYTILNEPSNSTKYE